ncbi:MAG TPA: alpha/beta fold hydrolase [Amycolatopsis sp.]|nr:alpha/beta fold hydrolase [Amycolatopsis sp.]
MTLRTMASEIASVVNHLVRYPSGIGHRWAAAPAADQGATARPLVVLPGLADNTSIFTQLKQSLETCGAGPVVSFSYGWLDDVRTAAARLSSQVEQLCAVTGTDGLDIVGHSLGGLIARYYVQRLGGHERVGTLVTIATPHGGTIAARLPSPLPVVRQLRPGSELLLELAEPAPECATEFLAFCGSGDELILPSRNALVEHPDLQVRNVVVRGAGHMALAAHEEVTAEICRLFAPSEVDEEAEVPTQRSA